MTPTTATDRFTTAHIEEADPAGLVVTRDFAASPEAVWRAFTDPALIRRWMTGYPGWSMPVCEIDPRVGGSYRYEWREDATGKGFGFFGDFREVDAPRRLVHKETFDPGTVGGDMGSSIVSTDFTAVPQGTRMVMRIDYDSKATLQAALATGMTDGMEATYSSLDGVLSDGG